MRQRLRGAVDERAELRDRIDYLASLLRELPDLPLTAAMADRLRIMARELLRRANR